MIRIGDFSKLSRVPIKTLRYYDEMELLKPAHVDDWTGYRYYELEQMARLNRILALKNLGFTLEQIGQLLDSELSVEQLRGMLVLRQTEIRQRVQEETERLTRVDVRLRQIEQEQNMSKYDVVIKKVPAQKVASVRGVVPLPSKQGSLWNQLEGYLAMHHVRPSGPCLSLYYDEEFKEQDWDIEVCEPLDSELTASRGVKVYELPAVETMACAVYQGPFTTIGEAYEAIAKWITENKYQIGGPAREVYLVPAKEGSQTDPSTVTEIQFPVTKT